jgi:hypothetical protein
MFFLKVIILIIFGLFVISISETFGQYGQQTYSQTTYNTRNNGFGQRETVQQKTVQKVGPYGQQTVQRETVVSQQPGYGYGK